MSARPKTMPTVLVTSSGQGVGFEFCRPYAAAGWRERATSLALNPAATLAQLAAQFSRVTVLALNGMDFATLDQMAKALTESAIDRLICNAGVNPNHSAPG